MGLNIYSFICKTVIAKNIWTKILMLTKKSKMKNIYWLIIWDTEVFISADFIRYHDSFIQYGYFRERSYSYVIFGKASKVKFMNLLLGK